MFDLGNQGIRKHRLIADIRATGDRLRRLEDELGHLLAGCSEFLLQAKHRTGAATIEEQVQRTTALKAEFIASFDADEAQLQRKAEHRDGWLQRHSRGV